MNLIKKINIMKTNQTSRHQVSSLKQEVYQLLFTKCKGVQPKKDFVCK